jgi:hypothetical protein
MDLASNGLFGIGRAITGQTYYLDWTVKGGLTTNTNVPQGQLYQPLFMALGGSAGIVYGNEADVIFPFAQDQVYMRGMIPIGSIQPYAGGLAGLSLGLSGGSIPVSDVQYNDNWMPCDGRALSATGASGFVDLFNLIGYTYSMRGVVTSNNNDTFIRIRPDRGTANLGSLGLGSLPGNIRVIKRTGNDSTHITRTYSYTGLTADGTTITLVGLSTVEGNIGANVLVDILSPKDGSYFFAPDLRGKAPFGEYAPYGARGEGFSLTAGATGGTATGDGGLFTNYIIRAKREADALILTGHNHDTRYLRKDLSDSIALAGSTLTLQNVEIAGALGSNDNIGIGMSPLSKNAGFTGYALSLSRAGDFATWVSAYNGSDAGNASAGYRANNSVANLELYLTRATSSTVIFQADSGCSGGILINSVSSVGSLRMATSGVERMRIDAKGTVKFPQGLTYSSLTGGSTPAKPTETIGLLNYDRTGGIMTLGSWSSGADALMTFITTKGGTASERMRIDPAGNVGIGTSNPTRKLHISSPTDTPSAIVDDGTISQVFAYPSQGGSVAYSGTLSNHAHALITNNAQRLWITNAGDIGIGTGNPNSLFNLYGNSPVLNIENADSAGNAGGVLRFGHNQSVDRRPIAEIRAVLTDGSAANRAGHLEFHTSFSGTLSPRMIILKDGNVGIGITGPTLNSNGKFIHIHSDTTTTAAASHYTNADTGSLATDGLMVGYWNDNSAYVWNYESTPLRFGTNATERLRIDSSGNVGIGTVSPTTKLDVAGGINSSHLNVSNGVTFASTSPSTSTGTGALVVAGGVGIGGSLYIGGGITATASIAPGGWTNGAAPRSYISTVAPAAGASFPTAGSIWFVV